MTIYNQELYEWMQVGSRQSAEIIVPYVMQLVKPQRVFDFGCGTGEWLAVFKEKGVKEVLGVDGGWFNPNLLKIAADEFIKLDFKKKDLKIDRSFDLAVTLEAIHHIPKEKAGDIIRALTRLAPVILFSAPIPYQRGAGFEVNEQWPEYWAELFKENGFFAADCLRKKIWADKRVDWWYSQNMLMFADKSRIGNLPELIKEINLTPQPPLSHIHPKLFLRRMSQGARNASLGQLLKATPHVVKMEVKRFLKFEH